MTTDIRPAVVDGILDAARRAGEARLAGQPWEHLDQAGRESFRSATRAEQAQVLAVTAAELADRTPIMAALWEGRYAGIDPAALALTAAVHHDTTPGLPDDMLNMLWLQAREPWTPRDRAVAHAITRNWTAARRADYEQRTGQQLPAGLPPALPG